MLWGIPALLYLAVANRYAVTSFWCSMSELTDRIVIADYADFTDFGLPLLKQMKGKIRVKNKESKVVGKL